MQGPIEEKNRPNGFGGRRIVRPLVGLAILLLSATVAACGQVITLTPTPTPAPTATIAIAAVAATAPPTPTPARYTPAPTATPTITPTPLFHTIESGDSLLGIADQHGLSVAALQEANGILDPRSLQLGQQLIIPREEELEPDALTTPTPTPLPVNVENVHFAETQIGGLWVLGEVYNDSDVPLEQVRVGVDLVDDQDNPIAQANSLLSLDLIDIGERAPFAVLFGSAPDSFDRYQVYPMSAVPAYVGSYYRDLEIRDLSGENEGVASYIVNGRVFNYGPEEAVSVQVVLTAYDPLDRVIAMRKIDPDHNVVPVGGETEFSAVLAPVGGPVARVEAVAQGRRISAVQE
jgi:LysM repeat protein